MLLQIYDYRIFTLSLKTTKMQFCEPENVNLEAQIKINKTAQVMIL